MRSNKMLWLLEALAARPSAELSKAWPGLRPVGKCPQGKQKCCGFLLNVSANRKLTEGCKHWESRNKGILLSPVSHHSQKT